MSQRPHAEPRGRACVKCGRDQWIHRRRAGGPGWYVCLACRTRRMLLDNARARASNRGVDFGITVDDIDIPATCPALGVRLVSHRGGPKSNSPTLDLLVPEWGYVPGNVAVISMAANTIKSVGTARDLLAVASWMKSQGLD